MIQYFVYFLVLIIPEFFLVLAVMAVDMMVRHYGFYHGFISISAIALFIFLMCMWPWIVHSRLCDKSISIKPRV